LKFLGYLAEFNGRNFRQEYVALYSDQLNTEPDHSTIAATAFTCDCAPQSGRHQLLHDNHDGILPALRNSALKGLSAEMFAKWLNLKYTESI
jgi:hypothetical protein